MAQIDPSIALSIKPIQVESPLVHAARAAELQGAQQTQLMNMLKMKEFADESRNKNKMTQWLASSPNLDDDINLNHLATQFGAQGLALAKQIDDRRRAQGEAKYRTAQIEDLASQRTKRESDVKATQREQAIRTISGFRTRGDALDMLYAAQANKSISDEDAENIRRMMPYDEEGFNEFKQTLISTIASPDALMKSAAGEDEAAYADYLMDKVINDPDAKVMSKREFISTRGQPSAATGSEMTPAAAPAATSAVTTAPPEAGVTVSAENTPLAPGVAELLRSRDPRAKETAKILQQRFENQIKSRQYTGDFANVQRARQDIANLRKQPQTPAIKEEIAGLERMIAGAEKGKGTTLTVGLSTEKKYGEKFAGGVADKDVALMEAAERAPEAANTANRILSLLQSGQVITGSAANIKLQMSKFLRLGGGSDSEAITNTEVLISSLADSTLGAIKSSGLGSGQGFTDSDRQFLERAKAGQITYEATSLKRLAELAHKTAVATADKWNNRSKSIPKSAIEGTGISTEPVTVSPILKTGPRDKTPAKNSKGWTLHTDKDGNRAYVSPDSKQFEEVK
jgi:hypothetical protein